MRGGGSKMWGLEWSWGGGSPLMRGTSSRAKAHFLFSKSKQAACGGLEGYGKGGNIDTNQASAHFPL